LTEEQLRQSQKMEAIGALAGSVAHDFNNLLSVIIGYSDILLSGLRQADPMYVEIEQIARAGKRANDLTRQLLAFSRQQVLEPRVVNLNEAISGVFKMLRRLVGEDVELTLLLAQELGSVFVDPGQIEQVLLNLVLNARDAMPQGGKLTIETADVDLDRSYTAEHIEVQPGRYVMLTVSDTGVGIDRATQARIFEPFFTTKEKGKGTGLGLSTVFGIVKQSGGQIWVYSEPGEGATFKVYFPRVDARADPLEPAALRPASLRGSETVLLVEDDEQVRNLAIAILRKHVYHVLEAATGGEALLTCEQYQGTIHVLLTDVVMPPMSGRQLWERLSPLRPAMKVLFMSGYTDDAIVHHGVLSSELAFVQKPLMPGTLLMKLRGVLDVTARVG
jgi:CheY-like chemotaxis protein